MAEFNPLAEQAELIDMAIGQRNSDLCEDIADSLFTLINQMGLSADRRREIFDQIDFLRHEAHVIRMEQAHAMLLQGGFGLAQLHGAAAVDDDDQEYNEKIQYINNFKPITWTQSAESILSIISKN
jgi:hypothetical protein